MTRKIKVGVGRTLNMGNYESLRLDVELEKTIPVNEELRHQVRLLTGEAHTCLNENMHLLVKEIRDQ